MILLYVICIIFVVSVLGVRYYMHKSADNSETYTNIHTPYEITLYYTNWCNYCKLMKPVWAEVRRAVHGSGIIFKEIDADVAPSPDVSQYPTIMKVDGNGKKYEYTGSADFEQLRNWVLSRSH